MFARTPYDFVRLLVSLGPVCGVAALGLTGRLNWSIAGIPAIALALPAIASGVALVGAERKRQYAMLGLAAGIFGLASAGAS
jgi:hypothetical protein